ncbi:MAG: hypothetical protein F4Y02_11340 [Chloroflexi bacterium]|nr:hypothetical protein [Chloroflexota bacterium]
MRGALLRLLAEEPVSAVVACRRLGVSLGYLAYRFPVQLRLLRERWAARVARDRRQEHDRKVQAIQRILARFRQQGVEPVPALVIRAYYGDGRRKSSIRIHRLVCQVIADDR